MESILEHIFQLKSVFHLSVLLKVENNLVTVQEKKQFSIDSFFIYCFTNFSGLTFTFSWSIGMILSAEIITPSMNS